jgi:hypothetical protein
MYMAHFLPVKGLGDQFVLLPVRLSGRRQPVEVQTDRRARMQESNYERGREQATNTGRETWQEGQTGYQYSQTGQQQGWQPGQQQGMQMQHGTGMQNEYYNLISVLYHALQGADTIETYIRDAQQSGNRELEEYFRKVQQQYRWLSDEGRKYLAQLCQMPQMSQQSQMSSQPPMGQRGAQM